MNDTAQSFAAAMRKLGFDAAAPKIAIAVSGGGDSLALTLLLRDWAAARGGEILALTVDHGLRPGSRAEAEKVHTLLAARGIRHDILSWTGDKPVTHIHERARTERYRLLQKACRQGGINVLAVAHNLEDQIETFWMRLAKGSGLDGLAAMAPSRDVDGLNIIRPLLGFSRAGLRAVCTAYGVEWLEDPSNSSEKFLRAKLRPFEELLAAEGLSPQRLAQVLQKLEEARAALQSVTKTALDAAARFHPEAYATLDRRAFERQPAEIQRRMLSLLLQAVAPQPYTAGFESLEQARCEILDPAFAGRTLAGCEIFPHGGGIVVCREAGAAAPSPLRNGLVWDGRLAVSGYLDSLPLELGILGEAGSADLRKKLPSGSAELAQLEALPFKVRKPLAVVRQGENILAVPQLNWVAPGAPPELRTLRLAWLGEGKAALPP
jgi:tRNA(Ile)-lysidine synthase